MRYLFPLLAGLLLTGCQTIAPEVFEAARQEGEALRETLKTPPGSTRDRLYLGSRTVKPQRHGEPLPARLDAAGTVVINSEGIPLSLQEIAALMAAQLGIAVRVDSLPQPAAAQAPPGVTQGVQVGMRLVTRRETTTELLSQVASWFDVTWRYEDGEIVLARFETRTYTLASLLATTEVESKVSTSGMESFSAGSGGSSSSSSPSSGGGDIARHQTEVKAKFDPLTDIRTTIEERLGGQGSVVISPALGTVTVTAAPAVLRDIARYVETINEILNRQVRVNVKVLVVTTSDERDLGLDLSLALQDIGVSAVSAAASAITGGAELGVGILDGMAEGSSAVIRALQTVGNVRLVTEGQVLTRNNSPAPLVVARQKPYVVGTETVLSEYGAVTSTEIGNLVNGYAMQVLPRVLDDGQVLLHFSVRMTELREMTEFSTGDQTYQQPDVDLRAFTQEARLRSGDTLVLAGFQALEQRADDSGLPLLADVAAFLGGSSSSSESQTMVVLLITPFVEG